MLSIIASTYIGYALNSGVFAYGLIILTMLLIVMFEFSGRSNSKFTKWDWFLILITLCYISVASISYLSSPLGGRYFTTHLIILLILPALIFVFIKLFFYHSDFNKKYFLQLLIYTLLFGQVIVCLGQVLTYTFGFGLPVSEEYSEFFAITGTFTNPNDLAAVVSLVAFIFIRVEKEVSKKLVMLVWLAVLLLLLLTSSRSALFVTFVIFIISRNLGMKTLIHIFTFGLIISLIYSYVSFSDDGVVGRIIHRLDSISLILSGGLSADGSMSARWDSYMHFLNNLSRLGFGTGKINDYFMFANNATFKTSLLFQNPHSLIVELGYWLGWPGLFLFLISILSLLKFSNRKFQLLFLIMIVTLIPSSVLGNLIFFFFMILCFFDKNHKLA